MFQNFYYCLKFVSYGLLPAPSQSLLEQPDPDIMVEGFQEFIPEAQVRGGPVKQESLCWL